MAPKVVVSSGMARTDEVVAPLRAAGCQVVQTPLPPAVGMQIFSDQQKEEYFSDADAFIAGLRDQYSRDVLEACVRLKIGSSPVIGTEHIDVEVATELGIVIGYGAVPENFDGVAEAIIMLSAALIKQLPAKWDVVQRGDWMVPDVGRMVAKRTIGMIGVGNIGRGVARRLAGWETQLIAFDPYITSAEVESLGVTLVDLDTLLRESDVVSVQVTLTKETRGMIGEREFGLMKPSAYIINTARGPVIDEAALIRALDGGSIAGAGIDVWEQEPTPGDNPLRRHPRVIATGHKIGHSLECYQALNVAAVENTLRGLRGEEPLYVRNPKVLPGWRERLARLAAAGAAV
ncbi:MAG: NAD(P)-dependent oxidoreductase [Chloroflexota bacterium]